jgi:signal transduction histidine kinase
MDMTAQEQKRDAPADGPTARKGTPRLQGRGHFVEALLHDVKGPLGVADGYLSLIEDGVIDPASTHAAEVIARARQSIRSALGLLDDVVAYSEAGELKIHLRPVDLRAVVNEVAEAYLAPARVKGLTLRTRVRAQRPRVRTDPARLRQILTNLLSNAIKFTDRGGVEILIEAEELDGVGRRAGLSVRVVDSGCGIPPEKIGLLFREFSRLGSEKVGTGLGLALSRQIADALGARLYVESRPGLGSTFTLSFPPDLRERGTP